MCYYQIPRFNPVDVGFVSRKAGSLGAIIRSYKSASRIGLLNGFAISPGNTLLGSHHSGRTILQEIRRYIDNPVRWGWNGRIRRRCGCEQLRQPVCGHTWLSRGLPTIACSNTAMW